MVLGLGALAFVLGDERARTRFLAESGLDQDTLTARASEPELLGAVLDFLLADEALLIAYCGAEGLTPERVRRTRAALPGGIGDWA